MYNLIEKNLVLKVLLFYFYAVYLGPAGVRSGKNNN